MKSVLSTLILLLTVTPGYSQTADTATLIHALARRIAAEEGDKIHRVKFTLIKDFSNKRRLPDTLTAAFYGYQNTMPAGDTVLLSVMPYELKPEMKDYFVCPDYDARKGIHAVKMYNIPFDYWEGCETGKGDCTPLLFTRTRADKKCYLLMPCGGTETQVTINEQQHSFYQEIHLSAGECPPVLELSNLPDGSYTANMVACGLGGTVKFTLKTL